MNPIPVRVTVMDTWDEIALNVPPTVRVADVKARALAQARLEGAAVAAGHLAFGVDRLAAAQRRAHAGRQRGVVGVRREDAAPRLAHQATGRPAEHLLEAGVDQHEMLVARDRDADRGRLEDGLALQLQGVRVVEQHPTVSARADGERPAIG